MGTLCFQSSIMRYLLNILIFFILSFQAYGQSTLCTSYPSSFGYEYVANVTINGQTYQGSTNFTSANGTGPNGYFDYTQGTPVPTMTAGQPINISYTITTNGNYLQYTKLWIDFDGDNDLTDPGELVMSTQQSVNGIQTYNATFTVPTTVVNGTWSMRFVMTFNATPTLCGSYPYGNTLDFIGGITGAMEPITADGYIKGAEEVGIAGQVVYLKTQNKNQPGFSDTTQATTTTDSNGYYSFNTT